MKKIFLFAFFIAALYVTIFANKKTNAFCDTPDCNHVAVIGEEHYDSLMQAVDAAQDGDVITINKSHTINCEDNVLLDNTYKTLVKVANKSITIDLNGKELYSEINLSEMLVGFLSTETNGHLTLIDSVGTGLVKAKALSTVYGLIVNYDETSTITINGGSYVLDQASDSLVFSGVDNGVCVNGGNFMLQNVGTGANGSPWIFNVIGKNAGSVIVNGGNYNAAINRQYYLFEVEINKGKALRKNEDDTWDVVDAVAYVNEQYKGSSWYTHNVGYSTLEEAIIAADNADTTAPETEMVYLLSDCNNDSTITIDKDVVITKDENFEDDISVSCNNSDYIFNITDGKTLTIKSGNYLNKLHETPTEKIIINPLDNKMTFAEDVRNWCVDGYVVIENISGFYDVVKGYEVQYYGQKDLEIEDLPCHIEPVAIGNSALGCVPTKTIDGSDYGIVKWYDSSDFSREVIFPTQIEQDTAFYGVWENVFIVRFETNGGSLIEKQVLKEGNIITRPDNPFKTGYNFLGWYQDEELTQEYDFNTVILNSITLYAKWEKIRYSASITSDSSSMKDVSIDKLNEIANDLGKNIILTIKDETLSESTADKEAIQGQVQNKKIDFFDISLKEESNAAIETLPSVVEIEISFNNNKRENITVYRYHEDKVDEFNQLIDKNNIPSEYVDGTFYADAAKSKLYIYTDKFSTYAIAYTLKSTNTTSGGSSGGSYNPTYSVTSVINGNGNASLSQNKASKGSKITIATQAEEGNKLGNIIVMDDKNNEITLSNHEDGTYSFKMPKSDVVVKIDFVTDNCHGDGSCVINNYNDMDPKGWYHDSIHYCIEKDIMTGYKDGKFQPNIPITRAMLVVMLWRMDGKPMVDYSLDFTDVVQGKWYTDAIKWARANGIFVGYKNNCFGINDVITPTQINAVLWRYLQYKGNNKYNDNLSFTEALNTEFSRVLAHDNMQHDETANIYSTNNNTRVNIAAIIYWFSQNVLNNTN